MITFDFNHRTAIVTGGARGIGRAAADRLRRSGARVAIWDLLPPEASEGPFAATAGDFHVESLDVTDEAAVDAAAARSIAALGGRIDILVNGAGVTGPTKPLEAFALSEWKRVIDINLDGTFLCCRAVVPTMKASRYGRIVSIASVAGKQGNPGMVGYSAAKAGVIAFTKALGLELAETGILVNCVTPGLVRTELLREMTEEAILGTAAKFPLRRVGTVDEIAAHILWAASEECSFVTGAAFDASGGRSSY